MSRSVDSRSKKSRTSKLRELLPECYSVVKDENICYPRETSCSEGKKNTHRCQPVRITQVYNGLMSIDSNQKRNASAQKLPIRNLHKLLASPKRNIRRRLDNTYDPPKEPMYKNRYQATTNNQRNDKMISDNKLIGVKQSANGTSRNSQYSRQNYLPVNTMRKINETVENNQNSNKTVSNERIISNGLLKSKQSMGSRKSYLPMKTAKNASRHTLYSIIARPHIQTTSVINNAQEKHFIEFDVVKGSSINVNDQDKNMEDNGTSARNDEDIQANIISSQAFLLESKNSLLHLEDINDQLASPSNLISLDSYMCATQLEEHNNSIDDTKLDSRNNGNSETTSIVNQLQEPSINTQSPVTIMNSTKMSKMPTICNTETSDILEFDTMKLDQLPFTCSEKTNTILISPNNVHTTKNINPILYTQMHSDAVNLPISNVNDLEGLCIDLENTNISIINNELHGTNLKHLSDEMNPKINENRQSLIILESNLKSSICVHEKELSRLKLLLTFVQNMLHPNVMAMSEINLWKSSEDTEKLSIQQIECTSTVEKKKVETPPNMDLLSKMIKTEALISENVTKQDIQVDKDERNNSEILEKVAFQSKISNTVENSIKEMNAKEGKDDEEEKENFKTPSKRGKGNKIDYKEKYQQKRRSARLIAKQMQSPQITDDSFVTLEKTLNITHVQSKPCTPYSLRTPHEERNWERESGKKSARPLREYMNLKSTTTFLETPDVNRFQRRLNEADTPLHSRTMTSFLSNKLLTQLVDLHGESPEYDVSIEE